MRVFITGLGALTACGATAGASWQAIKEGNSGIAPISQWDLTDWSTPLAGELKDIQLAKLLPDRKLIKAISRHDVFGIHAGMQAVDESGLIPYRDSLASAETFNEETGIYVSSPGNKYFQQYDFLPLVTKSQGKMPEFAKGLFDEVHPMWLLRILPNNVLAYTGITYGFKGPNHNFTNHAAGSTQAILEAFHAIKTGIIKRAIVIGYDLTFEPQSLFYYNNLQLISKNHLKPFEKSHDGTILGEGAAALVLESEASVSERQGTCFAEIKGGLSASEGSSLFCLKENGAPLADLISESLNQCQLKPDALDFIVAHGNGNPLSDNSEAQALTRTFGTQTPPITAFKWAMGHTICASGLMDTVFMTYALKERTVPGIPHFEEPAPHAQNLNLSKNHRLIQPKSHALLINRGFGGMNACLVVQACD